MTSERMPGTSASLARVVAMALGLGFVWFVSAGVASAGVLSASGVPGAPSDALVVVLAVLATAGATVAAMSSARILLARTTARSGAPERRPREHADLGVTITQSRPDAPGRPRTRAPGRALQAA